MSEFINNSEMRQKTIKDIIRQLHEGKTAEEVKSQFEKVFHGVSASEISKAEGALIAEGLPVEEVQKLCDVHAAVFKGTIEEIHQPEEPALIPGHPVQVLVRENKKISHILEKDVRPFLSLKALENPNAMDQLKAGIDQLKDISIHYKKKENLYFPYMEKYGVTAPPKVMWGVDDEIKVQIKEVAALTASQSVPKETLIEKVQDIADKIQEMIFKEENIMVPMMMENLTMEDWKTIAEGSGEIGYMIEHVAQWEPEAGEEELTCVKTEEGIIKLPSGELNTEELTALLNTLPFDITFVDEKDEVRYFSEGKDRAFPRTRTILGRNVSNCHPPASVHIVEKIVEDFKSGRKDEEDFWIRMGSKYILIRYYAVRNEAGKYLGVAEVTQDIDEIQKITGEKRLMTE
ncbi:DUF438 domain-containing protein [Clostridium boliviensis]|uniref:DUF438 domain-containing protein n=1 Tax=Clostridium boliviensis TaxID=318465 RepID=A0ABU4GSF3_9CLOT|nr:DUF438 domain-containing protein [Clostridium boliviensis]MDW2800571.1 DUF438 domain-containing protein [Clostridium boliviensis]